MKKWKKSPALLHTICLRMSEGESLRKICLDHDMPSRPTVLLWLDEDEEFQTRYARACKNRADHDVDRLQEIEMSVLSGALDPQAARVVIGSIQWRASKMAPKKYSDRLVNEHTGRDGGPVQTEATVIVLPSNGRDG